ncbi:DUF4291 domain-containing protein [Streptomyces yerevanensis]|uniref:DUF4291 domain-containing protein n=1 Tax=Streptomyces yerevanensis TaxID=66378 RepID=UPI00069040CA|nr:DUF4291 domain-containing protein [Streptomyces yerevanensis]
MTHEESNGQRNKLPVEAEEPKRLVKAGFGDSSITVYQAYPREIAERAVHAGTFVAPFKKERMTWIKPSFLWMMYRSGWATKPNQEHVLAVEISRAGFEWALAHSALSHFDRRVHPDEGSWRQEVKESPVRIQWDPERSLSLDPLPTRAIQIGLSGEAVELYVHDWITSITDVTDLARSIHSDIRDGNTEEATQKLPTERHYPLAEQIRRRIGADG